MYDDFVDPIIFYAIKNHKIDLLENILSNDPAAIDVLDSYGYKPLHEAVWLNKCEIIKLLLKHNASIDGIDIYGFTPIFNAVTRGNLDMVKFLVQCGASVCSRSHQGTTVLNYARSHNNTSVEIYLENCMEYLCSGTTLAITNDNEGIVPDYFNLDLYRPEKIREYMKKCNNLNPQNNDTPNAISVPYLPFYIKNWDKDKPLIIHELSHLYCTYTPVKLKNVAINSPYPTAFFQYHLYTKAKKNQCTDIIVICQK